MLVAVSNSATRDGRLPINRTAVSPTPSASNALPGASRSIVAMEEANTAASRMTGVSISGPSPIRVVAVAAKARLT